MTTKNKLQSKTYNLGNEKENTQALNHAFSIVDERSKRLFAQIGFEAIIFARNDSDVIGLLRERCKDSTEQYGGFADDLNFIAKIWNMCRECKNRDVKVTLHDHIFSVKCSYPLDEDIPSSMDPYA